LRPPVSEKTAFAAVMLVVVASLALSGLMAGTAGSAASSTYTINGLTCTFPQGTPTYVQNVVGSVTQSPKFLTSIGGTLYVFASYDNQTGNVQTIGNVTTILPDDLEIGFTTRGAATVCGEGATVPFSNYVDVQVPIIHGVYDVAAEMITSLGPPR